MSNIQLLIESLTRCSGNCSGCALSSSERTTGTLDLANFVKNANKARELLERTVNNKGKDNIESITVFLGQGDHFLLSLDEIRSFMDVASTIIPDDLKSKTVLFITASAIGKEEHIKQKMDYFYQLSLEHNLPFFIQTVFDPKKIRLNDKFEKIYINNIMYFKEKCGMTELTLNLGEDVFNMAPEDFHDWVKTYGFRHVEMNWVNNINTRDMWRKNQDTMLNWLISWTKHYIKEWKREGYRHYEINFIPFIMRNLKYIDADNEQVISLINETLSENFYIDVVGNEISGQMGLISNLTPIYPRHSTRIKKLTGVNIYSHFLKNKVCCNCELIKVCSTLGVYTWPLNGSEKDCDYGVKPFLDFMIESEKEISQLLSQGSSYTIFDKNPVHSSQLVRKNNATHTYFESLIKKN